MRYGIREICNVVFRATADMRIGSKTFKTGQPVFFMDSAKTSTLESAATAVYATGGRGNTRLVTWEGEKTLTFTVEDALLSPISFAMLSGAGVVSGGEEDVVHVHMTTRALLNTDGTIDLSTALSDVKATAICDTAPLYVMKVEEDGSITGDLYDKASVSGAIVTVEDAPSEAENVIVDYYVKKVSAKVKELQVTADKFGGTFYVEADTLFRAELNGQDYPANITIPKAKIQTNWTFSMASTGDPSTFSFVMDAMPGYTYFNKNKKVLCVIQIVEDANASEASYESVMKHEDDEQDLSEDVGPTPAPVRGEAKAMAEDGYTEVDTSTASYDSLETYFKYDADSDTGVEDTTVSSSNFGTLGYKIYTKA